MKDIERIDFDGFNKPKHFPEWLCDGETLELAKLGDDKLAELDENTRAMSGQYDIDTAKGAELDRIGKILGEERNGNDDAVYRMYLKLRTMLNNADGTVEDIIKFCKFFFSSEEIHLVPNYPAGIRILHDGSNDTINFNSIIKQIVGAGIAYDTRELFNMTDEMPFEDTDEKRVHRKDKEHFARSAVFRNGRVLRDGRTVLDTEQENFSRDGSAIRNGGIARRNGTRIVSARERIDVPVFRRSGIIDLLVIEYKRVFEELWRSNLLRNGAVVRDGSERRSGYAASSINDTLSIDTARQSVTDEFPIFDIDEKAVVPRLSDTIGRDYRRNGRQRRNGVAYRASDRINDVFLSSMQTFTNDAWTEMEDALIFDRLKQWFVDNFPIYDTSKEKMTQQTLDYIGHNYQRNRILVRNGKAYRSSDTITDPSTMRQSISGAMDDWRAKILRNNSIYRNGIECRGRLSYNTSILDSATIGIRHHYYRDDSHFRNAVVNRDSGVLIPA